MGRFRNRGKHPEATRSKVIKEIEELKQAFEPISEERNEMETAEEIETTDPEEIIEQNGVETEVETEPFGILKVPLARIAKVIRGHLPEGFQLGRKVSEAVKADIDKYIRECIRERFEIKILPAIEKAVLLLERKGRRTLTEKSLIEVAGGKAPQPTFDDYFPDETSETLAC